MTDISPDLQRRIESLTNLKFTIPTSHCPHPRPYLPLFHPKYPFLSLTLPTYDQESFLECQQQVECLNDPRVATTLSGPPFPYTLEDAKGWAELMENRWKDALKVYKEILGEEGERKEKGGSSKEDQDWRQAFPNGFLNFIRVASCREEQERGQGEWIGDIGIGRWLFEEVQDPEERKKLKEENDARKVGDPVIKWSIGYYLKPSWQGQQIATYALKSLLSQFMLPTLLAKDIYCTAYVGNIASRKVQEKSGFEFIPDIEMWTDRGESRGGGLVKHWVTRYRGGRLDEVEREIEERKKEILDR